MGVVGQASDLVCVGPVGGDQAAGPDAFLVGAVLDQPNPLAPFTVMSETDEAVRSDGSVVMSVLLVPDDPDVLDREARLDRSGSNRGSISQGFWMLYRL